MGVPNGWHVADVLPPGEGFFECTHAECYDKGTPAVAVTKDGQRWAGDALCAVHMALPDYDDGVR